MFVQPFDFVVGLYHLYHFCCINCVVFEFVFPPRVVVSWWTVSTITSTAAAAETRATVGRIASAPPQSRHKHPRNARQITPDYLRECIVERRPNRRWVSVFENGPLALVSSACMTDWTSLLQVDFLAPLFIFKSINRENFLKFGVK